MTCKKLDIRFDDGDNVGDRDDVDDNDDDDGVVVRNSSRTLRPRTASGAEPGLFLLVLPTFRWSGTASAAGSADGNLQNP